MTQSTPRATWPLMSGSSIADAAGGRRERRRRRRRCVRRLPRRRDRGGRSAVDTATGGAAGDLFNAVDNTVFDSVDYITDGAINIDYDDGSFSRQRRHPRHRRGRAPPIGEDGITASCDTLLGSTDVGVTDHGLSFERERWHQLGPAALLRRPHGRERQRRRLDQRPHPGHGAHAVRILSGQASGGFVKTDDGLGNLRRRQRDAHAPVGGPSSAERCRRATCNRATTARRPSASPDR